MQNITVVGTGYVGLSLSVLLARHHRVTALDIDVEKVRQINERICPIKDSDISASFTLDNNLKLFATTDSQTAYENADLIIVATPTDYNAKTNHFDTSSVETVLKDAVTQNTNATIMVKSTVPVGFTAQMQKRFETKRILFSPEFLREGLALHDNLYPSRIVVGGKCDRGKAFAKLLLNAAEPNNDEIPVVLTGSTEAEAVKLFSNTYLAMRVAYFNELDSYCEKHDLASRQIIEAVGLDPRIGQHYNNPSFGYGGYCLPKDTKQLLANYAHVPNNLIAAIVKANDTRKDFIAEAIVKQEPKTVGVYRLVAKSGSDNLRDSAVQGIIQRLIHQGINVIIFEPILNNPTFMGGLVEYSLAKFKSDADLIIANRLDQYLDDVSEKVYSRDLFYKD